MKILFEIGNTSTKIGLTDNDELKKIVRIKTTEYDYNKFINDMSPDEIDKKYISSVNEKFTELIHKLINKNQHIITYKDIEKIIKLNIEAPAAAGIDRLINAAYAYLLYKKNIIIIDFGTATKIDVVDSKGQFAGGIIMPGIITGVSNMILSCDRIKSYDFKKPENIIGKNTDECVNSGMYYGVLYTIRGYINVIENRYKSNFTVIATGGLSNIFNDIDIFDIMDEYFTLKGINEIVKAYFK